ncbi:MAG: WXG100 family type VII secretion target [Ornithinibacter sp.]
MTVVPGDPASLSACAGTVRSVAQRLTDNATAVRTASGALGEGWAGRTSAATRRRATDLASATQATADQLDRVGRVLQDHATDLADLVARGRAIEERARTAGLEVREGRVEIGWGVTGPADADAARARAATQLALQAELDLVLAQHVRRRDWVLGVLRDSTTGLSALSHRLRGG